METLGCVRLLTPHAAKRRSPSWRVCRLGSAPLIRTFPSKKLALKAAGCDVIRVFWLVLAPCNLSWIATEKKLVFVHYRETLDHLASLLFRHGIAFARFEGSLSGPDKDAAIAAFRDEVPVLLCTESGGEGRNIQFCNTLINFDVPWNPMAIEQRIGRIDRIGQHREVFVFNLVTRSTLEEQVLHLLDEKISMFELVVGEVGAILGGIEDDKDFSDLVLDAWLQTTEATVSRPARLRVAPHPRRRPGYHRTGRCHRDGARPRCPGPGPNRNASSGFTAIPGRNAKQYNRASLQASAESATIAPHHAAQYNWTLAILLDMVLPPYCDDGQASRWRNRRSRRRDDERQLTNSARKRACSSPKAFLQFTVANVRPLWHGALLAQLACRGARSLAQTHHDRVAIIRRAAKPFLDRPPCPRS
jgi:superfamily II DNA/RNA helicase